MSGIWAAIGILPRHHLCNRNVKAEKKLAIDDVERRKSSCNATLQAADQSCTTIFRSNSNSRNRSRIGGRVMYSGKKTSLSGITLDVKTTFFEVFESLKSDIFDHHKPVFPHHSLHRLHQMMDYTVFTGQLVRGVSVIQCYESLKEGDQDLTEDELFRACVLGWCVELIQASCLVLDDIMDHSQTRRGHPCWYTLPQVGESLAINDGFILLKQVHTILKNHFTQMPYYMLLQDLFNEVEYQTTLGQMLDLQPAIEGGVLKYSMIHYNRIVRYKTSFASFYLPVACALVLAGEKLDNHAHAKDLLVDMGIPFQVANDYQDCFGDPKKTGKNGTDIEDCKLSWVLLQAMEICSEEQKKIILEHYGKGDENDVAKVKGVYKESDLQSVFHTYQTNIYQELQTTTQAHSCKAVQAMGALSLDHLSRMMNTL